MIGATSSIAEHCARIWAMEEPAEIVLVGRDLEKLEQIGLDLQVRSPKSLVNPCLADFEDPTTIQQLVTNLTNGKSVDIVLIAHGWLPEQLACQNDLALNKKVLEINAISPVLFAEAFANAMEQQGKGTLVVIGSVAGDRGRKSNYVYGAAKGLVERYTQGLQHRMANKGVKVVLVKPGPTDTPMTAHLKQKGAKLASAESVAREIVVGVNNGSAVVYAPKKWQLIMWVVRSLPRVVFNKTNL